MEGLIHEYKHNYIASLTSPPYVGKQLTVPVHTFQLSRVLEHTTNNLITIAL